jgi:hypothetical protein
MAAPALLPAVVFPFLCVFSGRLPYCHSVDWDSIPCFMVPLLFGFCPRPNCEVPITMPPPGTAGGYTLPERPWRCVQQVGLGVTLDSAIRLSARVRIPVFPEPPLVFSHELLGRLRTGLLVVSLLRIACAFLRLWPRSTAQSEYGVVTE